MLRFGTAVATLFRGCRETNCISPWMDSRRCISHRAYLSGNRLVGSPITQSGLREAVRRCQHPSGRLHPTRGCRTVERWHRARGYPHRFILSFSYVDLFCSSDSMTPNFRSRLSVISGLPQTASRWALFSTDHGPRPDPHSLLTADSNTPLPAGGRTLPVSIASKGTTFRREGGFRPCPELPRNGQVYAREKSTCAE